VDIYQTEEQQVDAIKAYWSKNGSAIIAGLVLGFSGFIGFNLYKDNQLAQELAVSDAYQSVVEAAAGEDEQAYTKAGEKFIADNTNSSYSTLTALALAKEAAGHKDWAQVEKYLSAAIASSSDAGIKGIATLRLARVQTQLEQYDKALATLAKPLPVSYTASVEEAKGDVYIKQGKNDLARDAYQAALNVEGQASNQGLTMKLNDLAETVEL